MHLRATKSTSLSQKLNICLAVGGESSFQPCIEPLTSLYYPQKAPENLFWPPKALTRFLMGTCRAFLRDGHSYATLRSDSDFEGCRKVALFVGTGYL